MSNKEKLQILCIDDDAHFTNWERAIRRIEDYDYDFTNLKDSDNVLKEISSKDIKMALIDMNLGAGKKYEGINVAKLIRDNYPNIYIVLVTVYGLVEDGDKKGELIIEIKNALEKKYIDYYIAKDDFVKKSNEILKKAIESLNNPSRREYIRKERIKTLALMSDFKVEKSDDDIISETLIGKSKTTQELKKWIVKFAKSQDPIPVLITGETGTGKEVVANLIHQLSSRKNKKMRSVNCAAIPDELIESELFGHVKGAFTGAIRDKDGQFLIANNSTLFLDEIGDLSLSAQAKILRAIQEKKIDKVGGQEFKEIKNENNSNYTLAKTKNEIDINVNVRIICATNKDLKNIVEQEINNKAAKEFRHDLFYRLSGFHIKLMPLRDRLDDIPDLVTFFTRNKNVSFTPNSIEVIQTDYNWPGNIRELKSFVDSLRNLFPEKSPFEVQLIKEALELWKGLHPQTNFLFSNDNPQTKNNKQKARGSIKKYTEYKPGSLDEIEKRFRILAFAMKHDEKGNEIDYIEKNLEILADRGKKIHENVILRNKALYKMENKEILLKGFTSKSNGITQWFSKADQDKKNQYIAVIEHFSPDLDCLKELSPIEKMFGSSM